MNPIKYIDTWSIEIIEGFGGIFLRFQSGRTDFFRYYPKSEKHGWYLFYNTKTIEDINKLREEVKKSPNK